MPEAHIWLTKKEIEAIRHLLKNEAYELSPCLIRNILTDLEAAKALLRESAAYAKWLDLDLLDRIREVPGVVEEAKDAC